MKKLNVLFTLVLLALVLSACASQAAVHRFVQLPDVLQQAIYALAVFVVGWVFAQVGAVLPWFVKLFGQYADEIAFALAGAVVTWLQSLLNLIPPAWEGVGNLALALVVAVLAALQLFRLLGKAGVKSFR